MSTARAGHATAVPSGPDREYLRRAHRDNLAAIASGRLAAERGHRDEVVDLGRRLLEEHTDLDTSLVGLARDLDVPLPDTPGADLQAGLARVVARSGPGLDAAWLALEVSAHRRALQAADTEQAAGSHAQVRDLARTNGARLRGHLDEIVRVAADLGVSLAAEGVDPGRPVPGDPAAAGRAPLEPGEAIRRVQRHSVLAGLAVGIVVGVLVGVRVAVGRRGSDRLR